MFKNSRVTRNPAGLLAILLIALVLVGCTQPDAATASAAPSATVSPPASASFLVVRVTLDGAGSPVSREIVLERGKSAFDALRLAANVDVVQYPFGVYVRGINDVNENQDGNGKYWQYYIDGTLGPVGIDQYAVDRNLTLALRYEVPDLNAMNALNASSAPTLQPATPQPTGGSTRASFPR